MIKPDLVPQERIVEEIKSLTEQKKKIQNQIEEVETKQRLIESSLAENDHLKERVKALLAESLSLFEEEWKRKSQYYPDIWLAVLEQAAVLNEPPKK